jgi:hypothetical protein
MIAIIVKNYSLLCLGAKDHCLVCPARRGDDEVDEDSMNNNEINEIIDPREYFAAADKIHLAQVEPILELQQNRQKAAQQSVLQEPVEDFDTLIERYYQETLKPLMDTARSKKDQHDKYVRSFAIKDTMLWLLLAHREAYRREFLSL